MQYSMKYKALLAALAMLLLCPAWAAAQYGAMPSGSDTTATINAADALSPAAPSSVGEEWNINVGGGAAVRPTYEGSDRYRISPVPFVKATYNDMVSLGLDGLNAYWHYRNFRIGGGLTYNGGRRDSSGSGIFRQGDDRLSGLGNIDGAMGLKCFSSYDFGMFALNAAATKYTGGDNNGLLVDLGASFPWIRMEQFSLTPYVNATWADNSYMKTFFGVSHDQAAHSHFSEFSAESGVKDVAAGINADYRFAQHWFIGANADVKELTGDAARSPVVFSDTQFMLMSILGYHF